MENSPMTRSVIRKVSLYLHLLLSVYLFLVATRIEILNYRAGGILPRRNLERMQNPKWRVPFNPQGEPLTQKQLFTNRLHEDVVRFGLLQYPLVLVSIILSLTWLAVQKTKWETRLLVVSSCLTLFALISLLIRDYFGSLGW